MMQENKIQNILIADDHLLVRAGLEMICTENFPEYILHLASNFEQIIEKLNAIDHFDLLILDINFENENSLLFIDKIIEKQPHIPILIYTGLNNKLLPYKLKSFGVKGMLSKLAEEIEIINAIRAVLDGCEYFPNEEDLDENAPINRLKKLSTREIEVMNLYIQGYGNIEISNKLDIQSNTISTYKKRILDKLEVKNLTELISLYRLYFSNDEELQF